MEMNGTCYSGEGNMNIAYFVFWPVWIIVIE